MINRSGAVVFYEKNDWLHVHLYSTKPPDNIGKMMSSEEFEMSRLAWRKASRSAGNGECVEVASAPAYVAIRDSKNPAGPSLAFAPRAWQAFADHLKSST